MKATMDPNNINHQIPEKVLKFEEFVNNHLKEDLKKIHYKLDVLLGEMAEYIQLKNVIESLQSDDALKDGLKTQMDLGCNFYMQAHVSDVSRILIDVGCGYFVQFTLDEALKVIAKRLQLLEKQADLLKEQSATTKAHIKLVLHGIQELHNIK
ncbi:protein UXT homolog [Nilaparvata lugens]|uniref:protein UXT homolog n=1 Tax=Nilaparvata lugens TaxID=108931 RepID=UPI00193D0E43|nr:protein UXT homolog [Nilaparvata lugens]XP_039284095.1 protein UXT homolog [Nilaparvata lugens]XP_039300016.1 protein UXT homolog [Nilaparvata lugens]XP_039300017.1 protein UXT homolog [Nilaparvata lugens]XP_039300018.1 protein UXT homolog [Nilaparvata lugens]